MAYFNGWLGSLNELIPVQSLECKKNSLSPPPNIMVTALLIGPVKSCKHEVPGWRRKEEDRL